MKGYKIARYFSWFIMAFLCLVTTAMADSFSDDFSTDTTGDYTVTHTWTQGGTGQFLYDAPGQRAQVLTGDDVGLKFSHTLPSSESGVFSIDFLPTTKYPSGGIVSIYLVQDPNNYYKVKNTNGYGPGRLSKYVGGVEVDSATFQNEYSQNNNYHIAITFSPAETIVEAFGEVLVINTDTSSILVNSFEVTTTQQDAYYDNIVYTDAIGNNPPDAVDDALNVNEDSVNNGLDVLANDTDPDVGDTLTITLVSAGDQGGTTSINDNGTPGDPSDDFIDYTPPAGFAGDETFTYTIEDVAGLTDTATVTVTVGNINDPPDAVDDTFNVNEDSVNNALDVLANDTDPDVGDTLTITLVSAGDQGGTTSINDNGTPGDPSDDFIDYTPPAGFAGDETFTYTIEDVAGLTDTATVTVTVGNINDPPDAVDDTFNVNEDSVNNALDVLANDTDPDVGDTLTIALVSAGDQGGTTSINDNGTPGDPSDDFIDYTPPAGFAGDETFTYTIEDVAGLTDTATVTVTVGNINDPPDAVDDTFNVNEDSVNNALDVLANDTDPDVGDTLTITLVSAGDQGGTTSINDNGTPADPSDDFIDYTPPAGFAGDETFTYTIEDTAGLSDTATVTVTVEASGTPSFSDDFSTDTTGDYTVTHTWTQGGTGQFLYDAPGQRAQVLTGNDVGLKFSRVLPASDSGIFSIDFLPTVTYPNGGSFVLRLVEDGNNYYKVKNTDGYGPGYVKKVVDGLVVEDVSFQNEYTQNINYNITITFSPAGTTVEAFGEVLVINTDTSSILVNSFEVTTTQQDAYYDNIVYTDAIGNNPPDAVDDALNVNEDSVNNALDVLANDTDPDVGDTLTITLVSAGDQGGTTSINDNGTPADPSDDFIDYTPPAGFAGDETFTYTIEDTAGLSDTATVTVTVEASGTPSFSDDFSTDTTGDYTVTHTWTQGGTGQFLYDAPGQRAQVLTGNDVGLKFSRVLPASDSGIFSIDFLPTVTYPNGGSFVLRLVEDGNNYYKVKNTDGYGPGYVKKVVDGLVVEDVSFQNEYTQNINYNITITFSPAGTTVEAFGEVLVINTDTSSILVNSFEVTTTQQDAYYDNIVYTDAIGNNPPDAVDDALNVNEDSVNNALDVLANDTDPDVGDTLTITLVSAGDQGGTTSINDNGTPADPSDDFIDYTPPAGFAGDETFTYTIEDTAGLSDTATVTVTVEASGTPSFSDDFSTDTTGDYTVTHTWTQGGTGQFLYDAPGQRAQVLTGNDVGLKFSRVLPASDSGIFSIDFLPTVTYPNGGSFVLRLVEDGNNYYKVKNTDGYGPGYVKKVVDGLVVEDVSFQNEYTQNINYNITITFSPAGTTVEAFGEVLVINTDTSSILVNSFEVTTTQQDAYYDNIVYTIEAFVKIIHPQSYHLQVNTDLTVQSIAGNLQTGWGVEFVRNISTADEEVIRVFSEPYNAIFTDLEKKEHTVDAFVIDQNQNPVSGSVAHDYIIQIGIGDYYVAIGDSITFGVGDEEPSDDISIDGRNTGGGYTPILNDLLTDALQYSHTIVNEGIGGEESIDGLARIQSVIDAHPEAQYFLILFGTNDSGGSMPVPSGLGLDPGDTGYSGAYKDNMQQICDAILAAGKSPVLAKVPIALGPCSTCTPFSDPDTASRNTEYIQKYNLVIEGLVSINGITVTPPDFYALFNEDVFGGKRYDFEYFDNLHPNGTGYQSMADRWFNALTLP